ncbi:MAG: hypothetical protein HWN81_21960, partial [Candidatus Lokiarchaeota archaeon]|nr:hypothetical protein [Candidatus Lokiarchaeota archaeon]
IICNQRNEIITKSFLCSNDKTNWKEIQNCVYSTDYINITANFKNSNGQALIYITSTNLDICIQNTLEKNKLCLPIWCPLQNTSIYENNSLIEIKIITFNGTIAGITTDYLRVVLVKNETSLVLTNKLRDYYVQGTKLKISVQLTCRDKFLVGEPVFFKITEIISDNEIKNNYLNDTICEEGHLTIEYDVPKIDFFNIEIFYQGSVRYYSSIFIKERIEVRSPTVQFFIDSLIYFILILIMIIGITLYYITKRYQMKSKRAIWKEKTGFYNDINNIDYILVLDKISGSAIIKENLSKVDLEGNLISGLLQVITYFKYELKKQRVMYDSKEKILIDYQDYKILLRDGEFSRVALIIKQTPSENLQLELVEFIKHFEIKYKKYLEDFTGELTPFQDYIELINKHFKIHMTRPLIVNKISPNVKINTFQETLINTAKLLEKENKQFTLDKLLNDLIIIMPNEPEEKLLANIYNLIEFEYFHPIDIIS